MNSDFSNKINSLSEFDKKLSHNYFVKQTTITNMFEMIRGKMPFNLSPFGNYNAKVSIIIDFNKTNDRALDLLKKFYSANKVDFYSLYITPFSKTGNASVNKKLIEKEHEIINPTRTVILGDFDIDLKQDVFRVSKEDLNTILLCVDNEDIKASHKEKYEQSKAIFLKAIQFALYGKKQED